MRVGLIGAPEREELQRLAIRLEERGAEGVFLDPREGPRVELAPGRERACGEDLAKLGAFYVADLALSVPGAEGEDELAASRRRRASQLRLVLWNTLLERLAARARVVNPPATHALHGLKPYEMAVYSGRGLPAPRTLATSAPAALLELPTDRAWITKDLVGGYGYTQPFEVPRDAAAARALLADGPLMVQERVDGENVRAFVVGGELVGAAEVVPTNPGELDSRRGGARLRRVELPEEARRMALDATAAFALPFSAVDLMRDSRSGRYLLLECNSAPFFVEFERRTGIDVSSPLADLLTKRV